MLAGTENYFVVVLLLIGWGGVCVPRCGCRIKLTGVIAIRQSTIGHNRLDERVMMERMFQLVNLAGKSAVESTSDFVVLVFAQNTLL